MIHASRDIAPASASAPLAPVSRARAPPRMNEEKSRLAPVVFFIRG
jgi:hypothetical protein